MYKISYSLAALVLALQCGQKTFYEFSNLPPEVHWVLRSSGSPLMTLSDLRFPHMLETGADGTILRSEAYTQALNYNVPECTGKPAVIKKYYAALVKYNNLFTGQAPDLLPVNSVQRINEESEIGQFEFLNMSSLWLVSERSNVDVLAQPGQAGPLSVLHGEIHRGTRLSDTTLVALNGAFRYTMDPDLAGCFRAGYASADAFHNAFRRFRERAEMRGNSASVVFYSGAVVGTLIALTLKEAELASSSNFGVGHPINAQVKVDFSSSNVSITYEQHGSWKPTFDTTTFLTALSQRHDPMSAMSLVSANTQNYAVIGVVPERLILTEASR